MLKEGRRSRRFQNVHDDPKQSFLASSHSRRYNKESAETFPLFYFPNFFLGHTHTLIGYRWSKCPKFTDGRLSSTSWWAWLHVGSLAQFYPVSFLLSRIIVKSILFTNTQSRVASFSSDLIQSSSLDCVFLSQYFRKKLTRPDGGPLKWVIVAKNLLWPLKVQDRD